MPRNITEVQRRRAQECMPCILVIPKLRSPQHHMPRNLQCNNIAHASMLGNVTGLANISLSSHATQPNKSAKAQSTGEHAMHPSNSTANSQ
jgi:hypothetical protein